MYIIYKNSRKNKQMNANFHSKGLRGQKTTHQSWDQPFSDRIWASKGCTNSKSETDLCVFVTNRTNSTRTLTFSARGGGKGEEPGEKSALFSLLSDSRPLFLLFCLFSRTFCIFPLKRAECSVNLKIRNKKPDVFTIKLFFV